MADAADSSKRIALVTGASRGIGRAVARALAGPDVHLLLVARTTGALEELDDEVADAGGTATLVPLDLKDFDGIDRMGAAIHERWGRLDMLVGNAGMLGPLGPLPHVQPKTWEDVIALNLTANFRLIRSMDPLLRAAPKGRAVFVTSGAAAKCKAYWGPYSTSKAALEAMVKTYANETRKTGVRVNLIDPGPTRTKMRAAAYPGENPEDLPPPEALAPLFLKLLSETHDGTGDVHRFRDGQKTQDKS